MNPKKVQALAQAYERLGEYEKYTLEFLSFCSGQITKVQLQREIIPIIKQLSRTPLKRQQDFSPIYKNLVDGGFISASHYGIRIESVVFEWAIRDAVQKKRTVVYAHSSYAEEPEFFHWYGAFEFRYNQRRFRQALYQGNETDATSIYQLILSEMKNEGESTLLPLAQLLNAGEDFSFLRDDVAVFLLLHLPAALVETQFYHAAAYPLLKPLSAFVRRQRVPDDDEELVDAQQQLLLLLVGECWLCGDLSKSKPIVKRLRGYYLEAANGVLAFGKGDVTKAVDCFESALAALRKKTRKKRLFFNDVIGEIFVWALLRLNSPVALMRAKELLSDAAVRTNKSVYQEYFNHFLWLVETRIQPQDVVFWEYGAPRRHHGAWWMPEVSDVLAKTLYSAGIVREYSDAVGVVEDALIALECTSHRQILANITALHCLLVDQPFDRPDLPAPSVDFYDGQNDWQLVLYNICQIGKKAEQHKKNAVKSSERLSFRISFGEWDKQWQIAPYIQMQTAKGGWSRGKRFSLNKRDKTESPFLTDTDERVIMLLDAERERGKNRSHYGYMATNHVTNHNDALYELAGHPYLFFDGKQLAPLEIEIAAPQVEVVQQGEELEIRMVPNAPCDKGFYVEKRSANLLRVTRFEPKQKELLKALGKEGSRFPKKAQYEIADAVSHMGTLAEVHSHVPHIGQRSKKVAPNQEMMLRMQPFLNGISAQFLVAPLGRSGPSFVPGCGPEHLFATVESRKLTATRNMQEESMRLDALLMDLGLYYTEEAGDGLYQFSDELAAVEFLSELENYKQREEAQPLVLEWPKGVKYQCSRTLFPKDFCLLVNKKRKWLALDGQLKVANDEVYKLAELVAGVNDAKQSFVQLKDGQFLRLSKSLQKFLIHLRGMGELQDDGTLQVPEQSAISVKRLADEAGELEANSAFEKVIAGIDKKMKLKSPVPASIKTTLRDYQMEGYRWLHRLSSLGLGACLADDMGLGKTLQALALMLHRLHQQKSTKPALVVAPVSVMPGWFEEATRFAPRLHLIPYAGSGRKKIRDGLKARQILVTSYGLLQRDAKHLAKISFDMIVLDEAQFIKNRDSARAKAAFELQGDFKMVTTGTPVENRLSEFWSLFHFINPGLLGSHKVFLDYYEKHIQLFQDAFALESLKWMVKPFLLRRTKEETLDELPPKTEIVRYCEMSKDEASFYELHRRQAQYTIQQSDSSQQMMELITALTTLRQAACHPRLIEPSLQIESSKLNVLKEILQELKDGGHQALIFSQFVKFLSIVRSWLDEQEMSYQYMDGSCTSKQRKAAVDAFQAGESDLFLISTRAGGFGLNLTAADYVVHLDPWWNPAVEDQASDRVHRIGQSRPVTIYKLVTRATVEEKVLQIHGEKRELATGLLEDSDTVAKLSMKELMQLI